jgi:hypothetical protein
MTMISAETERIVDYILAHRKVSIQAFLKEKNIASYGKKEELRTTIEKKVSEDLMTTQDLIAFLNTIEGWGNQHVYLYVAPTGESEKWKDQKKVTEILKKANYLPLLNNIRPIILPDDPTLSTIEWSPNRVRFVWVERRAWEIRVPELDRSGYDVGLSESVSLKAYQLNEARGLTSFDWNLATGHAALLIQRLPSGENYVDKQREYEDTIEEFIPISNFTRTRLSRSIKKLEASKDVRNRQLAIETVRGARIQYSSKSRKVDVFDDPDARKSKEALGGTSSLLGNFYWQPREQHLTREIHTKIYATDNRIGIFGECSESEVQYVLSRIRFFGR